MGFWGFGKEKRSDIANGSVPVSADNFFELMGLDQGSMPAVTVETALGVPAIWAAVNFIPGTLAGLPLNMYRKVTTTKDGKQTTNRKKVTNTKLSKALHDAANDETSSFDWRKSLFEQVLTTGRAYTYIERNAQGQVINFWPLDPACVKIVRANHRTTYEFTEGNQRTKKYKAEEIIDIAFMLKANGLDFRSPIHTNKDVIALAIAATKYGSKFFANGGVPPFIVKGAGFKSKNSLVRSADDFAAGIKKASSEGRSALVVPDDIDIETIGVDAAKSQLIEVKKFSIEEIARIYSIPPTFLQDLSKGTFANTEQQDLHFVKHTIKRWVEQFEQELNLKLFGRDNNKVYVELNMDGLLRGDFKTRMEAYASSVQNAIMKPNEVRSKENMPQADGGDKLMIQGATVPIENQGQEGTNNEA